MVAMLEIVIIVVVVVIVYGHSILKTALEFFRFLMILLILRLLTLLQPLGGRGSFVQLRGE